MRISLAAKITILAAALLLGFGVVMLVTFSVLSGRQVQSTIRQDSTNTDKQLAAILAERTARLAGQVNYAATGAAGVIGLFLIGDPATVQNQAPALVRSFQLDAITMTDETGRILGSSDITGTAPPEEAALRTLALSVNKPVSGLIQRGGRIYLASCRSVVSGDIVKGCLEFLQEVGAREASAIASATGDQVAFLSGGRIVGTSLVGLPDPIAAPGNPYETQFEGSHYEAVLQQLPGTKPGQHLDFLTLRNTSTITEPYRQSSVAFTSVLLVALVASVVCGLLYGRRIVKPLDEVVGAAREIRDGGWPAPFQNPRPDEIGMLQEAFNQMSRAAKAAQERILAMVDRDPLTDLVNHRRFRELLAKSVERAAESSETLSLMLIDIDRFSTVNDQFGLSVGDDAIRGVALAIRTLCPETAIVSRYKGDQFAALLSNATSELGIELAENLRTHLASSHAPSTVSGGVVEYPTNAHTAEGLVLAAELALTRAKELGRNRICGFEMTAEEAGASTGSVDASVENGTFATIQALAAAVDARDPYTNGHSERVAQYAAELARNCGCSQELVNRVLRCGTLHDVGKIGIPDSILKKTGALEMEERRIMETHPALGELIVGKVPQLAELLPGVRHHHERWDGRGYPDGLAEEKIPYIARLLAIADTYDAMTSDRPYRKGMPAETALNEIEKNSGKQFDPSMAPIFVHAMRATIGDAELASR